MRNAIWIGVLALALGACGSKATCERVMKRAVECQASKMGGLDGSAAKEAMDFADDMIGEACKQDEVAREAPKLEECTSKSDCAEVNACLEKLGGGALGL